MLRFVSQLDLTGMEKFVEQKCLQNSRGPEAFEAAKNGSKQFQTCIKNYINVPKFKEDYKKAKASHKVDELLYTLCLRKPAFMDCITEFSKSWEACRREDRKNTANLVNIMADKVFDFFCQEEGMIITGKEAMQYILFEFFLDFHVLLFWRI